MTLQSSFLVRCSLSAAGDPPPGKPYFVRHVQTGDEFRCGTLIEASQWMTEQNNRYLADRSHLAGSPNTPVDEDLQ